MEFPKSVFNPHLLSNFVHDPNAPTSNVPGDCAAADPPRSKAVIAQTVQLLLNMIVSSQRVEILCSGYRGCTLRREAGCMPSEHIRALSAHSLSQPDKLASLSREASDACTFKTRDKHSSRSAEFCGNDNR